VEYHNTNWVIRAIFLPKHQGSLILLDAMSIDSAEAKATAYTIFVRPLLEFSSAAWDPHLAKDVHQLECVQRRAARFVMNDYHLSYQSSQSVTSVSSPKK